STLMANEPMCRKMPSLRASSRNAASVASLSSGTIVANSRSRLISKTLVISGVRTYSAPAFWACSMSLIASSRLACGDRPARICTRPAVNVALAVGMQRAFYQYPRRSVPPKQQTNLARTIEGEEIIIAAYMGRADEDLRHGRPPIRPSYHVAAPFRIAAHVDLIERDALARQQSLRGVAVGTVAGGINLDHDAV